MNSGISKLYSGRSCELFKRHSSEFRNSLSAIIVLERERCTLRLHAIATSRTSTQYNSLTTLWILEFQSSIQVDLVSSSKGTPQKSQIRKITSWFPTVKSKWFFAARTRRPPDRGMAISLSRLVSRGKPLIAIVRIFVFLYFFDWHCLFEFVVFNRAFACNEFLFIWRFDIHIDIYRNWFDTTTHRRVTINWKWSFQLDETSSIRLNIASHRFMIKLLLSTRLLFASFIDVVIFDNVFKFASIIWRIDIVCIQSIDVRSNAQYALVSFRSSLRLRSWRTLKLDELWKSMRSFTMIDEHQLFNSTINDQLMSNVKLK